MTHSEYMQSTHDAKTAHRTYYSQFVTPAVILIVECYIGRDRIARSTDPHLNDIPLAAWDRIDLRSNCEQLVRRQGDFWSMATNVCIAKEAARQLIELAK